MFEKGSRFYITDDKNNKYYGKVVKKASFDENGMDLFGMSIYYVVRFDDGDSKSYPKTINDVIIGSCPTRYRHLVEERDMVSV